MAGLPPTPDRTDVYSRVPFGESVRLWAKVGVLSFGGPAGQIALMHRLIVDEKKWLGETRFLHALNYCMLLPGPEAQQLATYIGWLMHGVWGGLLAGLLFILPGALVMLGLSLLFVTYGELALVQALFNGLKAAILAIVIEALLRIARRALKDNIHWIIAGAAFAALFFFAVPFPLVVLAAGLTGLAALRAGNPRNHEPSPTTEGLIDRQIAEGALTHIRPTIAGTLRAVALWALIWLGPVVVLIAALGRDHVFSDIAVFFSTMAIVTFGGAYAVLAYVAQEAVTTYGWLGPDEMLKGLALAETTPGPLILVLEFVGFLAAFRDAGGLSSYVAGILGAALTLWVTFAPSFLWIFAGAPYAEHLRDNPALRGALAAITAAVVGVVLNLTLWFALHVLFADVQQVAWGPFATHLPVLGSLDASALVLSLFAIVLVFVAHAPLLVTLAALGAAGVAASAIPT
ncbi:MAG: chromate efflux transporter [Alphaproteobacteria bacterium]|nr:chromate efflux transporter [Alphaproteobacteria bacterium]